MSKWVSKLVTLAVAGLAIWWLAGEFGLLDTGGTGTKGSAPIIKLVGNSIHPPDVKKTYGDHFKGDFVVYNEGETTAKGCKLWLLDGSSERFDLQPTVRKPVRVKSKSQYRQSGSAKVVVRILCAGYEKTLFSQQFPF